MKITIKDIRCEHDFSLTVDTNSPKFSLSKYTERHGRKTVADNYTAWWEFKTHHEYVYVDKNTFSRLLRAVKRIGRNLEITEAEAWDSQHNTKLNKSFRIRETRWNLSR